MKRRPVLAGLLVSGLTPAARATADAAGGPAGMVQTFDYVPARDGLALQRGGPSPYEYAKDAAAHPGRLWQPRFPTEPAAKGGGNYWNGEYQFYADPEYPWSNEFTPFAVVDSALRIRAERAGPLGFRPGEIPDDEWTHAPYGWVSGVLSSKHGFTQQGGYFEVVAQMPKGRATWPAFWLLPASEVHPPEIDVVEYLGHEPDRYRATVISIGPSPHEATVPAGTDLSQGFHRYAINWTDTAITFLLDGGTVATVAIAGRREFWQPFYLLLNVAIGSRKADWVPAPDAETPSPADMLVQSVRVWQRTGPREVRLSATAIPEDAPPGTAVARLSCLHSGPSPRISYRILGGGTAFAIQGDTLVTRTHLDFRGARFHDLTIEAADANGRTWQQPVSITVLDAGLAPDRLQPGGAQRLGDGWTRYGVQVTAFPDGTTLLQNSLGPPPHAVEILLPKPSAAERYVVSADLQPRGHDQVGIAVSRNYGITVQAVFDLRAGVVRWQTVSADAAPFHLHDCRLVTAGKGFLRCQLELTTDDGPTIRISLKPGPELQDGPTLPPRGLLLRPPIRVVRVSPR